MHSTNDVDAGALPSAQHLSLHTMAPKKSKANPRDQYFQSIKSQKLDTLRWCLRHGGVSHRAEDDEGHNGLMVAAAGGFDESLRNAQDFDLWLKLLAEPTARFTLFGEPLARYHHVEGSIMSHTDRRIACCRTVAVRHLPALKRRGASGMSNLWRRLALVYLEAANAQPASKWRYLATGVVDILATTLTALIPPSEADGKPMAAPGVTAFFAIWVAGVLGLYLFSFRDLVQPIFHTLGF